MSLLTAEDRALVERARQIKAAKRKADKRERPAKVRPTAEGQRRPRVRNNGFLAFLRRQPCLNCGSTPSDAAHVRMAPPGSGWRYVGKAEKPDDLGRCVPLCRTCHTLQHSMNEGRFWSEILQRDPVETCRALALQYEASQ